MTRGFFTSRRQLLGGSLSRPNTILLLLLSTLLLLCLSVEASVVEGPYSSSPASQQNINGNNNDNLLLEEASEWLAQRGIQGLCHPTSDRYAPAFPKCQPEVIKGSVPRHLEQQQQDYNSNNDFDDRYYSYQDYEEEEEEEDLENVVYKDPPRTKLYYAFNGSMALLCVLGGALASGLTVGLLSLDPLLLVIKMRAGETEQEKLQAEKLLPLVKQHHRLLVTLLLLNTIAGEALPVFLQGMVPDAVAILISVILVLVFGEILPTALFTGPNQLQIASHWAPLVKFLMCLLFPVTYPIARLLDRIMVDDDYDGEEEHVPTGALYNRGELAALIRVQYEERLIAKQRRKHRRVSTLSSMPADLLDTSMNNINLPGHDLRHLKTSLLHRPTPSIDGDEVMIVEGALQMKTKTAMDIFLSFHKVFCIPHDMVLDEANIFTIYASGYSRVPVYVDGDRRLVKGILMTRQLMVLPKTSSTTNTTTTDNDDTTTATTPTVSQLNLHVPQCVSPETNLVELVNLFQMGGSAVRAGHMALVCARPDVAHEALEEDGGAVPEEAGLMGIITLEDVLEALLQEDILDEMDAAGRRSMRDTNSSSEQQQDSISESGGSTTSYRQLA